MKGYMNRYLKIDLTEEKFSFETPDEENFNRFIGGKGVGLKLLIDMNLITQDPFSPENPLIFITGPFTGTLVQTSARSTLVTKSPLTGTFLDSHVGGHLGPQIKKAGLDYIIITGKSKKPIYLYITSDKVKFEDATILWGKGEFETEKNLKAKYPNTRIAAIGQAGENRVKLANIGTDCNRHFGRGGSGAVMGSKMLKAIVIGGDKKIEVYDKRGYKELTKQLTKDVVAHPNRNLRKEKGTSFWIRTGQEIGKFLPTRNCQDVQFENYENLTSENMKEVINWKSKGCFNCAIQCSKVSKWDDYEMEGPEYETAAWLGTNCGISDPKALAYANYIADDFGLDTISTGSVIAFAMEAYEKGILTNNDTNNIELRFGNHNAVFEIIRKIAHRDGIGDILAEGTKIASDMIGKNSKYFAIQIAGMEISGVNIKGCASMGLALATADFASHTRVWTATMEMNGELNFDNTPEIVKNGQDEVNARNSLIVCDFVPFGFDRFCPIVEKITGMKWDSEKMMKLGEKISNLTRMYNIKNGRTRKDDTLPQRFFKERHLSGIFKGKFMNEEIFGKWLDMYYKERGWHNNGIPMEEKLKELDLECL